jgi:aspartate racemase
MDDDPGRPVVGILGGMGPAATADFFAKLVAATPARTDQDHLQVLLWSDPLVPDRSDALLDRGPDPTARLLCGVRLLTEGGARLIAVPCNTAHAFLGPADPVGVAVRQAGVEIVSMIDETAREVAAIRPRIGRVGLLATTGTVRAGLYQGSLARRDIETIMPTKAEQDRVAAAIRRVKAGLPGGAAGAAAADVFAAAGERLVARGARALIAGCTEIPLVYGGARAPVPVVDPGEVLAAAVVRYVACRSQNIGVRSRSS